MDEKWMQRRLRWLTLFCVLISIALTVGGGIAAALLDNMFKGSLNEQMAAETVQYKANIERKIDADIQTLATLSSFMEFSNSMDADKFAKSLYESNNQNSFIRMGYFEKDGSGIRVTINGPIEQDLKADQTAPAVYQLIKKAWQGETAVSGVYRDGPEKKEFIAYAVPVWKDDQVVGALTACDSVSVLLDILKDKGRFSDQGSVYIIGPDADIVLRDGNCGDGELMSEEEKAAFREAAGKQENIFLKLDHQGTDCQAYAQPLGLNDWYLLFAVTGRGMNEPMYHNMMITRMLFIMIVIIANCCIFQGYRMLKKSSRDLLKLAYYDPVTGAYNMVRFSDMLEPVLQSTREFSVVALNIRKFKFINEIFGNEMANRLLCEVKRALDDAIKENEFFCRETADKFYILFRTADREEVRRRLEKISGQISTIFQDRQRHYRIMLYMGVVTGNDILRERMNREDVMTHVMFALNKARQGQQDDIWFYNAELHEREELVNYIESHMNQALNDGEFKLFLQPKIELNTGKLGGAEALVRWIKADGNMIFPGDFIPLFEQNGFCTELDMYMMEQVCRQIRFWMDEYGAEISVSVNQSKLLFYQDGYVEKLCEIIERYHVPAHLITLEILEGMDLEDAKGLNDKLSELKEKGFKISMDDFGSGYSSFNTLSSLDIDELKLDRGFLMEMHGSRKERRQIVLEQIAQLARKMEIITVAEGVETKEDEAIILQAGCDYGQGYYYSKPICAKEFTETYISSDQA